MPGTILVLNGAPRSGKSALAEEIQRTFPGVWIRFGVDAYLSMTPESLRPGIGLRPGGEGPDLEPFLPPMYRALYASWTAHSREGLCVVADLGQHDAYSRPLRLLPACARLLEGLPAYRVAVDCELETVLCRRAATGYPARGSDGAPLPAVLRWQSAVHQPDEYDFRVDTTHASSADCAAALRSFLAGDPPPRAFPALARLPDPLSL